MADRIVRTPDDDPGNVLLRLSAQRALLGAVGPSVRAVSVAYHGQEIVFQAVVDPEASDDQREELDAAATEIIADYPDGWTVDVVIAEDLAIPALPALVYLRREAGDIRAR